MKAAKGYFSARRRIYSTARQAVDHARQYAYRDRRAKKREFRRLWITRIGAAARLHDLSYSRFMHGLREANVELDRKSLARIAYEDAETFSRLAELAKKA
jgi:large subunit ribosomal protein L20